MASSWYWLSPAIMIEQLSCERVRWHTLHYDEDERAATLRKAIPDCADRCALALVCTVRVKRVLDAIQCRRLYKTHDVS